MAHTVPLVSNPSTAIHSYICRAVLRRPIHRAIEIANKQALIQ